MKDAKGHGSDARGAAHQVGTETVGVPHIAVKRIMSANGRPLNGPMGRNWEIRHITNDLRVGDLGFHTRKEGNEFLNTHLDPANPNWTKNPEAMLPLYQRARRINLGIKS
jgi:hypothetical protein